MSKKTFKVHPNHHTATNARNVQRTNRDKWKERYWRKYDRRLAKNKRKKHRRAAKNVIIDTICLIAFVAFIALITYLNKIL